MTVRAVSFVPCAPLLIPSVAGDAAQLDEALRLQVIEAVRRLVEADVNEIVVVAPVAAGNWPSDATWDFAGFGVTRRGAHSSSRLPWPLGIGAWLLDEAGWSGPRRFVGALHSTGDGGGDSIGVLAVGDGSACRAEKAPGHLDPRAEAFDAVIAESLAAGDSERLAGVDDGLADELLCAGLPVWRWVTSAIKGRSIESAELTTNVAPYGVAYFVASWTLA